MFAQMKRSSKRSVRNKIFHSIQLNSRARMIEEYNCYGGLKVSSLHDPSNLYNECRNWPSFIARFNKNRNTLTE